MRALVGAVRAGTWRLTCRIIVALGAMSLVGCRGDRPERTTVPPAAVVQSPTSHAASTVADLPLIEVPVTGAGSTFAVMLTGDGGWASADRAIAKALATHGIPVVGLSSPRYLMSARSPEEISRDLARILRHYITAWGRSRIAVSDTHAGPTWRLHGVLACLTTCVTGSHSSDCSGQQDGRDSSSMSSIS